MDLPLQPDLLCRRWVHSRAEDSATESVYRPPDFPLPPSRGRSGFEFKPDGTFKRFGPGATDISHVEAGSWKIDDAHPDQIHVEVDGEDSVFQIQDLAPDRLTIQKIS